MVLPILYGGTLSAVCSVVCDHDGDWTWPDFDFVDGLCAAIGLWQHIRTLTVRQVTLARIGTPSASRTAA